MKEFINRKRRNTTLLQSVDELLLRFIKMKELEEYLKERTKELKLTDEVIIFDEKESSNSSEDI